MWAKQKEATHFRQNISTVIQTEYMKKEDENVKGQAVIFCRKGQRTARLLPKIGT